MMRPEDEKAFVFTFWLIVLFVIAKLIMWQLNV